MDNIFTWFHIQMVRKDVEWQAYFPPFPGLLLGASQYWLFLFMPSRDMYILASVYMSPSLPFFFFYTDGIKNTYKFAPLLFSLTDFLFPFFFFF